MALCSVLQFLVITFISLLVAILIPLESSSPRRSPNVIIFLADDTGYGDLQSFGHPTQEYGAVDRMAKEGIRFTQWTSAAPLCSPSRAAMLTGRYPIRSGSYGKAPVFLSSGSGGLPRNETTIPEILKELGYTTGFVGKWHLGVNKFSQSDGTHLPVHHGFQFVGTNLPHTNVENCNPTMFNIKEMSEHCYLYNGTKVVQQPVDFPSITRKLLTDAMNFIRHNKESPFFLQFSFPQTHAALFCDEGFCGKSKRGIYGDMINEMSWAIGETLDLLKDLDIEQNTLSLFLSDHGPEKIGCPWGGSAGLLRGGKFTTWEGGFRVPAVATWSGHISPGHVSNAFINTMDILPTLVHIAGSPEYITDNNLLIDGSVIKDIIPEQYKEQYNDFQDREILFYYCSDNLMAVRFKQYKIHYHTIGDGDYSMEKPYENKYCSRFDHSVYMNQYPCAGEKVTTWDPPLIFDLMVDPSERFLLDPKDADMKALLCYVEQQVAEHRATIVYAQSQFDKPFGKQYMPCCDPPNCRCNYEME